MAGQSMRDVVIRDLEVKHDRQVTPSMGTVKVGRWTYPARVYEGVAQYQSKDGSWNDVPVEPAGEPTE